MPIRPRSQALARFPRYGGSRLADYFANAAQGRAKLRGSRGSIECGGDGYADHEKLDAGRERNGEGHWMASR